MFELKGRYAFPDVNRDVVRNVSRAVCVRYLRTIGPLTIIKGLVRDVTYFSALSNNWFSSLASQARNSGSSPDRATTKDTHSKNKHCRFESNLRKQYCDQLGNGHRILKIVKRSLSKLKKVELNSRHP